MDSEEAHIEDHLPTCCLNLYRECARERGFHRNDVPPRGDQDCAVSDRQVLQPSVKNQCYRILTTGVYQAPTDSVKRNTITSQ